MDAHDGAWEYPRMHTVHARMTSLPSAGLPAAAFMLVFGALLAGCGPRMVPHVRDVRAFTSPEPCAQGPFELHQTTHGETYGESYSLVVYSPRAIHGHFQAVYDGEVMSSGEFGRTREIMINTGNTDTPYATQALDEPEPDNARCLVTASDSGAGQASTSTAPLSPGIVTTSPGDDDAPQAAAEASAPSLTPAPWPHGDARLYGSDIAGTGIGRIDVSSWSWSPPEVGVAATQVGTDFTIRIWSDLPNDLEDVTFVVEHGFWRPNVSDEEWAAHQEEQRREGAERRARDQRRAEERAARRTAHCDAHHEDEGCWGPGGYDAAYARVNAPHTASPPSASVSTTTVAPPPPPPPVDPGPPPPPRADPQAPKPSQNARWIPGYWRFSGSAWVWLGGMWDVPEADVEANLTVSAPSLPPPPRQEAAPAPVAGFVWVAGFWQWSGSTWVWVDGRWQASPEGAGSYHPPR